jgi:HEAT repeat protein
VLSIWAIGALAVLATFVAGHLMLRLMVQGARPVRDGEWHALALEAADRLGLTLPFSLLRANGILVPVASGWLRPRVLLPEGCDAWPIELRRAVLLHELAHVQRHDCLTQAIAQLAVALFWFHPAAWWAASRLQQERERACDDRVLAARMRASDYADHLLGMVKSLRSRRLAAFGAVAFARPSSLEGRLLAVLDSRLDRRPVGRRVAVPAALVAALLVLPFAALEPVAAGTTKGGSSSRWPSEAAAYKPSRVVPVADPSLALDQRVAWAKSDAGRASAKVYWVGWTIETSRTLEGNLLSDSEGISFSQLSRRGAFTLEDVLADRAQGTSDPGVDQELGHQPAGMLIRMSAGTPDRVRVQSPGLPVDFRGEPLYWLDTVTDEQAFAWLKGAAEKSNDDLLSARFVESVGFMANSALVATWLTSTLRTASSEHVRIGAAEGLSRHPSPDGVRLLNQVAHTDPSPQVRRASVEALGRFRTKEALDALLAIAGEKDGPSGTRHVAFDALEEQVGDLAPEPVAANAQPPAESKSKSPAPKSQPPAEKAAKPAKAAKSEKPSQPSKAKAAPSAMSERAAFSEEDAETLSGGDLDVQRQAVESLGRYPEAQSLPRLRTIAETSPHPELRAQAVESIGRLGSPAALAVLEDVAWKNQSARARQSAVEAMRRKFPPDAALEKLARIAETHPSPSTRRMAVETIGRVDSPRTLDVLGRIIADGSDIEASRQAVESLGRHPGAGVQAQLFAVSRSQAPDEVRRQAVESLGRRPGEGVSTQLAEIARTNSSEDVRRQAVESLGRRDEPSVSDQLLTLARENGSEEVQRQAVESLGRRSDPDTRENLLELARTHGSVDVQRQAVESLGRLHREAGGDVMADLATIARTHPSSEVRRQAVESMTRRDPDRALPLIEEILRAQK